MFPKMSRIIHPQLSASFVGLYIVWWKDIKKQRNEIRPVARFFYNIICYWLKEAKCCFLYKLFRPNIEA